MGNQVITEPAEVRPAEAIYLRVCAIMLDLLDRIARDIAAGTLPSPHLVTYEALCRAEAARAT